MADLFLSYSRTDRDKAEAVAGALEASGRTLWWDRWLARGEDHATVIEREIAAARCVVVGWSSTARNSLWVRAEATEALDQGKLVQIKLDAAEPPLPFAMLQVVDLSGWSGGEEQAPWPEVEARVADDPGSIAPIEPGEPPLQGFGKVAALGWTALGTAMLLALTILLVARGLISATTFGAISIAAAILAALLVAGSAFLLLRTMAASRR